MSTKFLIAILFFIAVLTGGIMTGDQEPVTFLEGALMISGFLGVVGTFVFLKNPKWNKKLW